MIPFYQGIGDAGTAMLLAAFMLHSIPVLLFQTHGNVIRHVRDPLIAPIS